MSERKINLEEIIRESIIEYLTPKLQNPGQALGIANRIIEKEWYEKNAMLEFGKQLLELAAENAEMVFISNENVEQLRFKESIGDISMKIDKQSILDTIKQIE